MKTIWLFTMIVLASVVVTFGQSAKHNETAVNRALFRQVLEEGLNQHNASILTEVSNGSAFVDHDLPEGVPQPASSIAKMSAFFTAFPDIRFTFENTVAEGDKIAGRGYFTGTHLGEFNGIPPTGKKVKVYFMDLWRFENGKFVEYWGQPDVMGLMTQLGVMPAAN